MADPLRSWWLDLRANSGSRIRARFDTCHLYRRSLPCGSTFDPSQA
jgi:hypothetical protein